jgi:cell wall-associated NlpC family hydrolase
MHGWAANEFLSPCSGPSPPPPSPPSPPSGNSGDYVGCFIDNESRDLDDVWSDPALTVSMCRDRCRQRGFVYAGLQYSTQCFCGNQYTASAQVGDHECNMVCGGQPGTQCGAGWRNSIYRSGAAAPAPAPPPPSGSKCEQIASIALDKVRCGCPYVWGGTSCGCGGSGGFDCSGIVYYSHRAAGFSSFPRSARSQLAGNAKSTSCSASNLGACQPGDLLFYCMPGGSECPNHVNMYAGNGLVVDCPMPGQNCQTLTRISYARHFWSSVTYCR